MANVTLILQNSLIYGLLLSVLMSALFLGGAVLSPDVMLRGYPPDIKAKYGPVSEKGERVRKQLALPLLAILVGVIFASIYQLAVATGGGLTFVSVFLNVFLTMMIFNLVDLVILDWLIFATFQPKFTILPGTEGLAGYKDYAFHFRAFLRGTMLCFIASLAIAGIAMAVYAVAG